MINYCLYCVFLFFYSFPERDIKNMDFIVDNGGLRLPDTTTLISKAHVKTHEHLLYNLKYLKVV